MPDKRQHRLAWFALIVALTAVLASCGGDDDATSNRPTSTPQPTADQSIAGTPTTRPCERWPDYLDEIRRLLPVPEGLCLVYINRNENSRYQMDPPALLIGAGVPVGGIPAVTLHEFCHAHQHRIVLDAGGTELTDWYNTPEGSDFVQATGWMLQEGNWVQTQPEEGWSNYINPLEDFAQVCAFYYDDLFDIVADYPPGILLENAPIRHAWASRTLPR